MFEAGRVIRRIRRAYSDGYSMGVYRRRNPGTLPDGTPMPADWDAIERKYLDRDPTVMETMAYDQGYKDALADKPMEKYI